MTRQQRLRVCGNLAQLMFCAQTPEMHRVYKRQYERMMARLEEEKAAQ